VGLTLSVCPVEAENLAIEKRISRKIADRRRSATRRYCYEVINGFEWPLSSANAASRLRLILASTIIELARKHRTLAPGFSWLVIRWNEPSQLAVDVGFRAVVLLFEIETAELLLDVRME
jgi:hypothetical protein